MAEVSLKGPVEDSFLKIYIFLTGSRPTPPPAFFKPMFLFLFFAVSPWC